jgi:hypothetical protein
MQRALAAGLAVIAAAWVSFPSRGDACENAVLATDENVAAVKDAERLLDEGKPAAARKRLKKALGDLDEFKPDTPVNRALANRVRRIRALAIVRLDADGAQGAADTLRRISKADSNNAAKQTDLAEALARVRPAVGRKLLEGLAQRDVLATPYAYAALARLRGETGDAPGRDGALAKCKLMAKVKSICKLEPPKS